MKTFTKKLMLIAFTIYGLSLLMAPILHVGDTNVTEIDYQILYDLDYPQAQLNNHSLREVFEGGNLVVNGDFNNGTTGWTITGGTAITSNGVISATGNGLFGYIRVEKTNIETQISGTKYYLNGKAKIDNNVGNLILRAYDGTNVLVAQTISMPTIDLYYDMSGIVTTLASGNVNVNISSFYSDTATQNGKILSIDYLYAFNLTNLGIDILTVSQMDYWFNIYKTLKGLEA